MEGAPELDVIEVVRINLHECLQMKIYIITPALSTRRSRSEKIRKCIHIPMNLMEGIWIVSYFLR